MLRSEALNVVALYIRPPEPVGEGPTDLISKIVGSQSLIDSSRPTLIAGDLKAGLDRWNERSDALRETLHDLGSRIASDCSLFTYEGPNGS